MIKQKHNDALHALEIYIACIENNKLAMACYFVSTHSDRVDLWAMTRQVLHAYLVS